MGLFDFFKRKAAGEIVEAIAIDPNKYLIDELGKKLSELNYEVNISQQYWLLTVNAELEIATAIIDSAENHPNLIHLMIMVSHKLHFPNGIKENIVGAGYNLQEKVDSVLKNFLGTTFPAIMDGFTESHMPELDFNDDKGVLWHPKLGGLWFQGQWENQPDGEPLFDLLKERLKTAMADQKFNWVKTYIARQPDGNIMAECLLNNVPWEDGYKEIYEYGKTWGQAGVFLGQKQFMMIRRCDLFDDQSKLHSQHLNLYAT